MTSETRVAIPTDDEEIEPTETFVEQCCEVMHDAYEQAAAMAGWEDPAGQSQALG